MFVLIITHIDGSDTIIGVFPTRDAAILYGVANYADHHYTTRAIAIVA